MARLGPAAAEQDRGPLTTCYLPHHQHQHHCHYHLTLTLILCQFGPSFLAQSMLAQMYLAQGGPPMVAARSPCRPI